jgi:2-iminobutanoate/2-iminopropanoate deaminase
MVEKFRPASVPPPGGPYSAGVRSGNPLFLAAPGPFDVQGVRLGEDSAGQVRAVFDNLERVANEAGTSLENAVRMDAYPRTPNYFDEFNAVMAEYVSEPRLTRTTIPVDLRGFDVGVDAVLSIPAAD